MAQKLFTAIIFFENKNPEKYKKINNKDRFISFVKNNKPGAKYINWYCRETKIFDRRDIIT